MFFKNLSLFRLAEPFTLNAEALSKRLEGQAFHTCSDLETKVYGWVPPVKNGMLAHSVSGQLLIALKMEEKILPGKVVNRFLSERITKIEEEQGRKVGRKEKKELKELVIQELRPRAFSVDRLTFAWIDPVNGWVAIDSSSSSRAEEVLELLRKSVTDPVPKIKLPATCLSAVSAMNGWIASEAPSGFSIDQDLELCSPEKSKVRYTKHSLEDEEVRNHLAKGKVATKLALTWNDKVSFILTDALQVKRLVFLDILKDQSTATHSESQEEQFDADFALMCGELSQLIRDLIAALGGEATEA